MTTMNDATTEGTIKGPELRRIRTLLGIILAMAWERYGLGTKTPHAVATRLEEAMDELREVMPGTKLEGNIKTISNALREAVDHFGQPPIRP